MKKFSILTLAVLMLLFVAAPAKAAEFSSGNTYDLGSDETVTDDLYVGAQDITIDGVVERGANLAGRTITISGNVKGDVQAAGETVKITGKVDGTLRVVANLVIISGEVGRDVFSGAAQTTINSKARIGGSLLTYSGEVDIDGSVGQDLWAGASIVRLQGEIGRNAHIRASRITFGDERVILGNLNYSSPEKLSPQDQQKVAGTLEYKEWDGGLNKDTSFAAKVLGQLFARAYVAMALVAIALLALWLTPVVAQKVMKQANEKWNRNFGYGILLFFVTPIVALALLLTIVGIPLALLLGAIYAVVWCLALLPAAHLVGTKIFATTKNSNKYVVMLVGILVVEIAVGILKLIPFIGSLMVFVVALWGFGVILTALWRLVHGEPKAVPSVESVK